MSQYTIQIGIAKTGKYASRESGDTIEMVERPAGGISVVVVDGQGSGKAAKALSMIVSSRAVAMLAEGVRDGAVVRGLNDILFAMRRGQVSASLDLLSIDTKTQTLVVSRMSVTPVVVRVGGEFTVLSPTERVLGTHHLAGPEVQTWDLEPGMVVIACTDGVIGAGRKSGDGDFDVVRWLYDQPADQSADDLADAALGEALRRDAMKPGDDMALAVIRVVEGAAEPAVRRVSLDLPLV